MEGDEHAIAISPQMDFRREATTRFGERLDVLAPFSVSREYMCPHDRGLPMKQHRNPGSEELCHKPRWVARVTRRVVGKIDVLGLELCADTYL